MILGVSPSAQAQDNEQQGVTFALDGHAITLVRPVIHGTPLADHLAKFGEVPYLLRLRTTKTELVGLLDLGMAHGARLELVCA